MSAREPDLDAEQEVDLGRYWHAIVARWWLPLAGLVAGAVIGYLISLGGSQVWKASSSVYLGQPYSVIGSVALQGKQTNPSTVNTIIHSEAAIDAAAAAAGMRPDQLRGKVSSKAISTGVTLGPNRVSQNPLVKITAQASSPRRASVAANALAKQVVDALSGFTKAKMALLEQRVAADQKAIDAIRGSLRSVDHTTAAVFAVNLQTILQDQLSAEQLVTQAKEIELPSVLARAAAVKETARSRRNSVVVAAFLGFLIGLIAALAWEPVAARRRT